MSGEVVIHAHWDGYSQKGKWDGVDDLTYAYPKEGVVGWFDSLVVPKGAKNIEEAKAFMNFYQVRRSFFKPHPLTISRCKVLHFQV